MNSPRVNVLKSSRSRLFLFCLVSCVLLWLLVELEESFTIAVLSPAIAILTGTDCAFQVATYTSGTSHERRYLNGKRFNAKGNCSFPLFHNLTDKQLFRRAVALAESDLGNITSSKAVSLAIAMVRPLATGRKIIQKKVLKEIHAVGERKIAFCFLTTGRLPFVPLWNNFFRGQEDRFNVYIHRYPMNLSSMNGDMGYFRGRMIPSDIALRATPGLISAARRLMANAILDDPQNEWFAILSETCIPVRSFNHVYNALSSTEKSIVEVISESSLMWSRYHARVGGASVMTSITVEQCRIGSQFFVMRKKHAVMIVNDTVYWGNFNHPCQDASTCYPEESYFSTAMDILDRNGTTRYTSTYVYWPPSNPDSAHPQLYMRNDISRKLISSIQERNGGIFLFARKFDEECLDALLGISDTLLRD